MIQNNTLKLIVYDQESLEVKVCLEKPTYIEYTTQYSEKDSAKLVFALSEQNSEFLKTGNIIWIEDDICINIETVKMSSENTISVWGSLCDSLPSKRAIMEEISFENESISNVFSTLFQSIDPITGITFGLQNIPNDVYYTGTIPVGNFLDTITNLCKQFDLGFSCRKTSSGNTLALSFIVYQGEDNSESVIMSTEYNSISQFEYTLDLTDEINFVRVLGENDIYVDVEKTSSIIPDEVQAVLKSNIKQGEMTEQEYQTVLTEKGQEFLSEHCAIESYSGTYMEESFVYGVDFNLGDIVTVEDQQKSFSTSKRVSGLRKQIDVSGVYKTFTFGDYQKTLNDVISTLNKKVEKSKSESTGGTTVKALKIIPSVTAPAFLRTGDFFIETSGSTVTKFSILSAGGIWEPNTNYIYGTSPLGTPTEGLYFIEKSGGSDTFTGVWQYTNSSWTQVGSSTFPPPSNLKTLFSNEFPDNLASKGDYWVKLDNTTSKNGTAWYLLKNTWVLQFNSGGSGITIPNAILISAEDVT